MHIIIGGIFDVDPADRQVFLKVVEAVSGPSRAEAGCLRFWFSSSLDDPNRFHIFEVWKDKAALDEHRRTPHYLKAGEDLGRLRVTREVKRYTGDEMV